MILGMFIQIQWGKKLRIWNSLYSFLYLVFLTLSILFLEFISSHLYFPLLFHLISVFLSFLNLSIFAPHFFSPFFSFSRILSFKWKVVKHYIIFHHLPYFYPSHQHCRTFVTSSEIPAMFIHLYLWKSIVHYL